MTIVYPKTLTKFRSQISRTRLTMTAKGGLPLGQSDIGEIVWGVKKYHNNGRVPEHKNLHMTSLYRKNRMYVGHCSAKVLVVAI